MGYPSDLTAREWAIIEPLLPTPNRFGRPRKYSLRDILNGLFYVDRTGCQWRYVPNDFPKWTTVYYYSRKWNLDGTMKIVHDSLRRQVRLQEGREAEPSAASIDSQSIKTSQHGGKKGAHLTVK